MANILIGGELQSVATGNRVASANAIYDYKRNKMQEKVNDDLEQKIDEGVNNLKEQVETIGAGCIVADITTSPSTIENGVSTPVTINVSAQGATKIELYNAAGALLATGNGGALNCTKSIVGGTGASLTAKVYVGENFKEVVKAIGVSKRIYFGAGSSELNASQYKVQEKADGSYVVNIVSDGSRVFFLVPNDMSIGNALVNGLAFPLEDPVPSTSKSGYKCYRSSNTYDIGLLNIEVGDDLSLFAGQIAMHEERLAELENPREVSSMDSLTYFEGVKADGTKVKIRKEKVSAGSGEGGESPMPEPEITINMQSQYADTATIALNAEANEAVSGAIVWSHNLGADVAEVQGSVLVFKKHYVGNVTVTANGGNAVASKTFSVVCNEVATSVEYEVLNVRMQHTEVEADATSMTVYYTGRTITHYPLKEDTVSDQSLSKTVTFEANATTDAVTRSGSFTWNLKTVEWSVVLLGVVVVAPVTHAEVGNILCSDGSVVKPSIASDGITVNSVSLGGKTPIGVCVVPANHMDDGKARFMSLDFMSCETPDAGSQEPSHIYWGNPNDDALLYDRDLMIMAKDGSTATYLRIGSKTQVNSYFEYRDVYDGLYYSTDQNSKKINPPFDDEGAVNEKYRSAYTATASYRGKEKTDKLIEETTAPWQTGAISNSYASGNYPAACCCRRYHTSGTFSGEWYLPTIGELGYLMYNYELINNILAKIGKAVNPTESAKFWSCNEYVADNVWVLVVTWGAIDRGSKNNADHIVRAFLAR